MANDNIEKVLMPLIEQRATKKSTELYSRSLSSFIDKNNKALSNSTPCYRVVYNEKERENTYRIFDIGKNVLVNVKNMIDIDKKVRKPIGYTLVASPFNIMTATLIKYFHLRKNEKMMNVALMNLTLSFYSIIHPKYFPYEPNPDIMDFTINRISNKFLFKQYGVVLQTLKHAALINHNSMLDELVNDGDQGVLDYLSSLNSRLNNQIQTFAKEYYIDYEKGNIIHKQEDNFEEDNFILTSNQSMEIMKLADNAISDFFTSRVNLVSAKMAAKMTSADLNILIDSISNMKENENEKVSTLIRNILITYVSDNRNSLASVRSKKFIAECISIYSKSNVKIKSIIVVKSTLDELLKENSKRYSETSREATKVNYRKALYLYFVFTIQQSLK